MPPGHGDFYEINIDAPCTRPMYAHFTQPLIRLRSFSSTVGQDVSKAVYAPWCKPAFEMVHKYAPGTKVHGFAMTSVDLMKGYEWSSVDSTSWVLQAGFGRVYVPRKTDGEYDFDKTPFYLHISTEKGSSLGYKIVYDRINGGESVPDHVLARASPTAKVAREWLESIGVDYYEARCDHGPRVKANVIFFDRLAKQKGIKLYYSGHTSPPEYRPEQILESADIMPTYYDTFTKGSKEPVVV